MQVWRRYLLIQIPGWALAAIILYALHRWLGLPAWLAAALLAADLVKDFLLFPVLRSAYENAAATGPERLIGETGEIVRDADPEGYLSVRGELWRVVTQRGRGPLRTGARARVVGAKGITLVVAPADETDGAN